MTTDRDQSDSASSQGVPTTTKNWKRQRMDSSLETPEGARPCQHCECGLLPPELWEQISLVLSHPVCGHLLGQPQETNILGFVLWFHLVMMPMHFCPCRAMTLSGAWVVSLSAWAAITEHHRLGGLNSRHLFFTVLEAGKSRIQVLKVASEGPLLGLGMPPCQYPHTAESGGSVCSFSFYKGSSIMETTLVTSSKPNYLSMAISYYHHIGG